jgi:hypothetical protein
MFRFFTAFTRFMVLPCGSFADRSGEMGRRGRLVGRRAGPALLRSRRDGREPQRPENYYPTSYPKNLHGAFAGRVFKHAGVTFLRKKKRMAD